MNDPTTSTPGERTTPVHDDDDDDDDVDMEPELVINEATGGENAEEVAKNTSGTTSTTTSAVSRPPKKSTTAKKQQSATEEKSTMKKPQRAPKPIPVYDAATLPKTPIYDRREHYASDGRKLCAFGGAVCTQKPMKEYDFCIKHILQDPTAPWKQCDNVVKGKRCSNPVSLKDNDDQRFCNTHKQMYGLIPRGSSNYGKAAREKRKQQQQQQEERAAAQVNSETDTAINIAGAPNTGAGSPMDVQSGKPTTPIKRKKTGSAVYPSNRPSQRVNPTNSQKGGIKRGTAALGDETDSDEESMVRQKKSKRASKRRKGQASTTIMQSSDYQSASETDSDLSDGEDVEPLVNTNFDDPLERVRNMRDTDEIAEHEVIRLRRERIHELTRLYHTQYRQLKHELSAKYNEFLRQRNAAANRILHAARTVCASDGSVSLSNNAANEKKGQLPAEESIGAQDQQEKVSQYQEQIDILRACGPIQKPNRSMPAFKRIEKYHASGKPLCVFSDCTGYRLLLSEFCFAHILFDPGQSLYSSITEGDFYNPALLNSTVVLDTTPLQVQELDKPVSRSTTDTTVITASATKKKNISSEGKKSSTQTSVGKDATKKTRALELAHRLKKTISRINLSPTSSTPQNEREPPSISDASHM